MTALLAAAIAIVLVVAAGAIAATYHALWNVWQSIVPAPRRKQVVWRVSFFSLSGGVVVLLIAASWGVSRTAVNIFGTLCLVALGCGLISVAGATLLDVRDRREYERPANDDLSEDFRIERYTRLERK